MADFSYTAIDGTGRTIEGRLAAGSRQEVYRQLEERSLTPVEVRGGGAAQGEARAESEDSPSGPPRLKRAQLILFTEELADLLDAGVQLQQALAILHGRQQNPSIRKVSLLLREELREGVSFSAALRKVSPSFDDFYCNLVSAGEVSGSLAKILRRLAANLTILYELQTKMLSAMIYPCFLILACILLMVVFMTVLAPQLTNLLASAKQELPLPTRILVDTTAFFSRWWWVFAIAAALGLLSFRSVLVRPAGRLWWDRWKLRAPLFGPILETRFSASFAQGLGALVVNGVSLLPGLRLMTKATGNAYYRNALQKVCDLVGGGDSLAGALKRVGGFAPLLVDLLAVGEQTGTLGRSLEKAARRFDKELDGRIKRLTALISPVIIIFMAIIVTAVAYSIVAAIFQSVSGIRSRG
ncbi:MAG TPA: type II secretion system F family protein [Verrucomicrobiales bacterium]|nr:type II secretion system F family protein [Verrucomicrobiales bacterium]